MVRAHPGPHFNPSAPQQTPQRIPKNQMLASPKITGHGKTAFMASPNETIVECRETAGHLSPFTPSVPSQIPDGSGGEWLQPLNENMPDSPGIPATIPSEHAKRTLILCFDGTGDQFDADNSNIVQLFSLLKKDDRAQQMVYYQAGIGTYISSSIIGPIMTKVSKTLDQMIAWDLDAHVMGGYEFLMQNYVAGDRICMFGFSRGAYTARALAGMIHKVGLLPACNYQQVPFAYKMYTRMDQTGWEQSSAFKKVFSIDVDIEFIGVWDAVDSVGLIPKRLPFTTSNTVVRKFRHAVSLNERRAKFKANLRNQASTKLTRASASKDGISTSGKVAGPEDNIHRKRHLFFWERSEGEPLLSALERRYSENDCSPTDVEEVWFSGCHCDVGGGSVSNTVPHSLARIMFDAEGLKAIGLDPSSLYPFVAPRPPPLPTSTPPVMPGPAFEPYRLLSPSKLANAEAQPEDDRIFPENGGLRPGMEEEEDLKDALCPVYDQLSIKWYWWILVIFPMELKSQKWVAKGWLLSLRPNLARPRFIPNQKSAGVKVHRSVRTRMEILYEGTNPKKKYSPRAQFSVVPTWVD